MEIKYKSIVTGPNVYLPGGILVEELVITQNDIDEYLSDSESETEKDAIEYYKEEYIAEWAQRWCKVQFLSRTILIDLDSSDSKNVFDADNVNEEGYIPEWQKRWCTEQLLTEKENNELIGDYDDPNGGHNGQRFVDVAKNELPIFDDDDGEEEEEEEEEWEDWK